MSGIRLAVLVAASFICATAVSAQRYIQGWAIDANYEAGQLSSCTMVGEYVGGQVFGVLVTDQYQWGVTISDASWRLRKGASIAARVHIDGRPIGVRAAKALSDTTAVIMLSSDQAFRDFQRGHGMAIEVNGSRRTMSLRGTYAAMTSLLQCVAHNATERSQDIQTGSVDASKAVPMPQAEALVFVSNLFSGAGLSGYSFDPPKDGRVSWSFPDGTSGAFFGFRNFAGTVDDLASLAIAFSSEDCKGDFATAKKAVLDSGGVSSRKLSMACREGDIAVNYFVNVLKASDLAILIMHFGPSGRDGEASTVEATNDSLATQAVITQMR